MAIARALITKPDVVFADEPTGMLDSASGREVLGLLRGLLDGQRQTVIMVSHDPLAASHADRVVFLADGRLSGELHAPTPQSIAAGHLAGDRHRLGPSDRAGHAQRRRHRRAGRGRPVTH